jgi:hypothetical protein
MKIESRNSILLKCLETGPPAGRFSPTTPRCCSASRRTPKSAYARSATRSGSPERAAHRIVVELAAAGYIARKRNGRRNHYTIRSHLPLPDPLAREQKIGHLLAILTRQPAKTKLVKKRLSNRGA